MIFIVSRTSLWDDEIQPCKEAFKHKVPSWHTRICNEEEFDRKFSSREGLWRSKGKNHTITKEGYITRQEDDVSVWCIEINSLEELSKFKELYGELILRNLYDSTTPQIEIYDDYRE